MKQYFISLNIKTSLMYFILALLIISVIASLIFENQSDLIVRNTILEAEQIVYRVDIEILKVIRDDKFKSESDLMEEIKKSLKQLGLTKYSIFNEQAERLFISPDTPDSAFSQKEEFTSINRSIFKKENQGKLFHARISRSARDLNQQKEINFYIPILSEKLKNIILKLHVGITDIEKQMGYLYRQLGLLVAGMALIVIIFAVVYNRMVINPVKLLSNASKKVTDGNYEIRVSVKNRDEIGVLSDSFNHMVESLFNTTNSLKDTIINLAEQNQLIQHELNMARSIQQGMLPVTFTYDRITISAYYKALEKISGDYYDIFEFPDGSCGIIIADVSGHGIPAALITIMAKFLFYTYGSEYSDPADLMGRMNREIARVVNTGDYVTAFYAIIDPSNTIRFASAGHHSALAWRKNSGKIEELHEDGIFMGLIEEPPTPYSNSTAALEAGDRLILYTDGITDQRNTEGIYYGEERLREQIISHAGVAVNLMLNGIIDDLDSFSKGSRQMDDYTLLVLEINA